MHQHANTQAASNVKNPQWTTLLGLVGDGGVWVQKALIDIAGDLRSGVVLSQLVYWTPRATIKRDGHTWIVKRSEEWWDECRIRERTARRIMRKMEEAGLVETQVLGFGGVPSVHVRIIPEAMEQALSHLQEVANGTGSIRTECPNGNGQDVRMETDIMSESNTETTTEITTEPLMAASPPSAPSEPRGFEDSGLDQDQAASDQTRARIEEDENDTPDPQTGPGNARESTGTREEQGTREEGVPRERVKWDTSGHAYDLCVLLQAKVRAEHNYTPKIKNSNGHGWVATMNRLITQGPSGHEEREPVPPEKITMMIEYIYTYGTEGDFRWADQVRSPHDLARHWDKLRTWANREHQERAKSRTTPSGETNQGWMVKSKSHG